MKKLLRAGCMFIIGASLVNAFYYVIVVTQSIQGYISLLSAAIWMVILSLPKLEIKYMPKDSTEKIADIKKASTSKKQNILVICSILLTFVVVSSIIEIATDESVYGKLEAFPNIYFNGTEAEKVRCVLIGNKYYIQQEYLREKMGYAKTYQGGVANYNPIKTFTTIFALIPRVIYVGVQSSRFGNSYSKYNIGFSNTKNKVIVANNVDKPQKMCYAVTTMRGGVYI